MDDDDKKETIEISAEAEAYLVKIAKERSKVLDRDITKEEAFEFLLDNINVPCIIEIKSLIQAFSTDLKKIVSELSTPKIDINQLIDGNLECLEMLIINAHYNQIRVKP